LRDSESRSVIDEGPELAEGRETMGVTPLDAEPSEVLTMPEDSLFPLLVALTMLAAFYGLLTGIWALAIVGGIVLIGLTMGWLWPTDLTAEG
jgi:hypothetical protein